MDVTRERFDVLPTWIQHHVNFKYWGENCLRKLAALIDKFLKVDQATAKRENYARVLIEVKVDEEFHDQISFINKRGFNVMFDVVYEWKPKLC